MFSTTLLLSQEESRVLPLCLALLWGGAAVIWGWGPSLMTSVQSYLILYVIVVFLFWYPELQVFLNSTNISQFDLEDMPPLYSVLFCLLTVYKSLHGGMYILYIFK